MLFLTNVQQCVFEGVYAFLFIQNLIPVLVNVLVSYICFYFDFSWILTAAHCLYGKKLKRLKVISFSHRL